ncbi:uncharacterized protein LOC116197757 isoform X2 [Punica granatum]|uniref:Uncharacterized protein LOC116197757 isoform X2 n=3 Tax=Punica granatum TaxID=22663 RepID=A0A6P8CNB2_PUNGR|nr:uncharacterized protein LOC116197757 isoform X2 [Punica granatum]
MVHLGDTPSSAEPALLTISTSRGLLEARDLLGRAQLSPEMEGVKEQERVEGDAPMDCDKPMPSPQEEEAAVKKKYGGIMPKKPPLISKDHERAYFDSADWALGKQGVEKPKGPLEALRPKLQPTQQQTRYRKSPYAPSDGEEGGPAPSEDMHTQ